MIASPWRIIRRTAVGALLLAAVVLAGGTLFVSVFRDRFFNVNMERLDKWVGGGGDASTLNSEVVTDCNNLVLSQAGALERLELLFIFRDELHFRIGVCTKMTVNRVYKQPEFENSKIVNMICDDPKPFHELFHRLCRRSGLRP
jgi:hypothetical protein